MKVTLRGGPNDQQEIDWNGGHVLMLPHVNSHPTQDQIEESDFGFAAVYLQSVLDPKKFMYDGQLYLGNLAGRLRHETDADVIARLLFMARNKA